MPNESASALGYRGGITLATQVADLDAALAWYTGVLGFEMLYRVDEIGWAEVRTETAGVQIGLSQVESPKVGAGPVPVFEVADIDAARGRLESARVRFDGPTRDIPGMVRLATFYDPDGNAFMLSQSLNGM